MKNAQDLRDLQQSIHLKSEETFRQEISLCHQGIGLFFEARHILSDMRFEIDNSADASRILVFRYLTTIPSTALWSLDALERGQWGIAGVLLRLLIEEVIGLVYYKEFPKKALKRIHQGGKRDVANVGKKLDELGHSHPYGLNRLHGELSTAAAHANASVPRWAGEDKGDETITIGNTPRYIEDDFSDTVEIVNRLLFMGIVQAVRAFPELKAGHDDWWNEFVEFTEDVEEGLPSE